MFGHVGGVGTDEKIATGANRQRQEKLKCTQISQSAQGIFNILRRDISIVEPDKDNKDTADNMPPVRIK